MFVTYHLCSVVMLYTYHLVMEYTPLLLLAFVNVSWCDVLSFMLLQNHPVNVQLLHQSKKEQKMQ
jgi:hypothetical protein